MAEPVKCEGSGSLWCVARENRKWQPVTSGETSGERPRDAYVRVALVV